MIARVGLNDHVAWSERPDHLIWCGKVRTVVAEFDTADAFKRVRSLLAPSNYFQLAFPVVVWAISDASPRQKGIHTSWHRRQSTTKAGRSSRSP